MGAAKNEQGASNGNVTPLGTVHRPHSRERERVRVIRDRHQSHVRTHSLHVTHNVYIPGTSARLSFVFSYILVHLQLASVFALFL